MIKTFRLEKTLIIKASNWKIIGTADVMSVSKALSYSYFYYAKKVKKSVYGGGYTGNSNRSVIVVCIKFYI